MVLLFVPFAAAKVLAGVLRLPLRGVPGPGSRDRRQPRHLSLVAVRRYDGLSSVAYDGLLAMSVSFKTRSSWVTLTGFVSTCRTPEAPDAPGVLVGRHARQRDDRRRVERRCAAARRATSAPSPSGSVTSRMTTSMAASSRTASASLRLPARFRRVALRLEQRARARIARPRRLRRPGCARAGRGRSFTPPVGRAGAGVSAARIHAGMAAAPGS